MFYAVPRPTRDGSKVNVGRPGPGGSSGVVWKQELGGGGGGAAATTAASERGWRATTSVEKAFWEKERKIGGNDRGEGRGRGHRGREEGARGVCRAKGAKRWDWPVLLWPPPWNPYREDASKGQVTSSCNPPSSPVASSPRNDAHPCRVHRAAPFSLLRPPPSYSASSRSRPSRARRFAVMGAAS